MINAPDMCESYDWSPIAAASNWSELTGVLAGFVFAAITVIISIPATNPRSAESARALKLLFTAFFGLVVSSYISANIGGEQTCRRADTMGVLVGGMLGISAVVMIIALSWLVLAYGQDGKGVLKFLRRLIYYSLLFVVLHLVVSSANYLISVQPDKSHTLAGISMIAVGASAAIVTAIAIYRQRNRPTPTDFDTRVSRLAVASLGYLAVASLVSGVVVSTAPKDWYPNPEGLWVYSAAWGALIVPLFVLVLAARAVARK